MLVFQCVNVLPIVGLILQPLLGGVAVAEAPSGCTNGFPARDRIVREVFQSTESVTRLVVIPEMNFTCNGTITGYTFAGTKMVSGGQNPEIQIWRQNYSQPGEYYRTGADITISEVLCDGEFTQVFDGVFHCNLTDTARQRVRPRDILGLELAPRGNYALDLLFARVIKGPMNYLFSPSLRVVLSESGSVNQDLPQITFNISGMHKKSMILKVNTSYM
jgi:hypothetical protein